MAIVEGDFGHPELVNGDVTTLHSHPGVQSGRIADVVDDSSGVVIFTNGFANSAHVVLTLRGTALAVDIPVLVIVSKVGFSWKIHKGHGGQSHTWDIYWIATDSGA